MTTDTLTAAGLRVTFPSRPESRLARTMAGVAALVYVLGAAIENMDILASPGPGSPAADIRATYADQAFSAVTGVAGAVALAAYAALAAALLMLLRAEGDRRHEPWAMVGFAGGIGGPLVAAVGLLAVSLLVADAATYSDDTVQMLFGLSQASRMVSGVFAALFLLGFGVAALQTGLLPRALAAFGCALAVPMALAPIAAFTGAEGARVAVGVAFGAQSLWVLAVGLWLLLGPVTTWPDLIRRSAFLLLVLAAGLIGLAMLAAPEASARFFAWDLRPEALSAFAGGVYVGSAAVYAMALARPWPEVRGLVLGAAVLSVSVLAWTLVHTEVFDFGRLQAWAWLVLFAGFSAVTVGLLLTGGGIPAPRPSRLALALATLLAALALGLWVDPVGLSAAGPFDLPPLGGRFAGSWVALLAVLLVATPRRFGGLALVLLPGGALLAALRTLGGLDAPALYLAVLAGLMVAGAAVLRGSAER